MKTTKKQKFHKWVRENPDKMERIYAVAEEEFDLTRLQVQAKIYDLSVWLISVEEVKGRGNYRAWGRFIMNNIGRRRFDGRKSKRSSDYKAGSDVTGI